MDEKRNTIARLEIKKDHDTGYFDGWFIDIHTNEKLFSRVYDTQKIFNHKSVIQVGDIFIYNVPDKFKGDLNSEYQRIYLISILDNPTSADI